MRGQVKIHQKKLIQKKRRRAFYVTLYSFVFIGFVVAMLSSLSQLDAMSLDDVSVRGNSRLSSSEVELAVKDKLVGNYGGFFSRANALLYPHDEIESALRALPAVRRHRC